MSQPSNDNIANSLIEASRREVLWPSVFAGVKNVVKANNLNSDTLTCLKGWLKSNDAQLHVPLLSLTVLHTMSLNCNMVVRNQMASPKLFQRLEKQLARPQGPQVATAIVQVLVDWSHLFHQEELGVRSRAVLSQPRYCQMAAGCGPSPAVLAMQEEVQLGIPPVAPIRGEDFIRWMYRGASFDTPNLAVPTTGSSGGVSTGLLQGLPGGAPPPIMTQAVPQLCGRMQADAQRLVAALGSCRTAARSQRMAELTSALDAGYREAERCSQWRKRVQDYTQHCDDSSALSAVLAATDVINQALKQWQSFTGREVYDTMRIAVPPPPSGLLTGAPSSTAAAAAPRGVQAPGDDVFDLFRDFERPQQPAQQPAQQPPQQQQPPRAAGLTAPGPALARGPFPNPSGNPFAGPSVASVPAMSNLTNWNPFDPPAPLPQSPASSAAIGTTAGAGGGGVLSAATADRAPNLVPAASSSWATFGDDVATALLPYGSSASVSTGLTSPAHSGPAAVPSPTASASPVSSAPIPAAATTPHAPATVLRPQNTTTTSTTTATTAATVTTDTAVHVSAAAAAIGGSGTAAMPPPRHGPGVPSSPSQPDLSNGANGPHHLLRPPPYNHQHQPPGPHDATGGVGALGAAGSGASLPRSATAPSIDASVGPLRSGSISGSGSLPQAAAAGAAAGGATAVGIAPRGTPAGGGGAAIATLDWQPEVERFAAELRALLAAPQSAGTPAPPSQSPSQQQQLLAAIMPRVHSLCESLAAKHARQVAALEARLAAAGGAFQQQQQHDDVQIIAAAPPNGAAKGLQGGGGGPSISGVAPQPGPRLGAGAGTGMAAGADPLREGPLHQGLAYQGLMQQMRQQRQATAPPPPQQFKLNAFADLGIA